MSRLVTILGVPTSAGAHHAGQDLAPAAFRAHGLVDRLQTLGLQVRDAGDIAGEVFSAHPSDAIVRNIDAVTRVALAVADEVEREVRDGSFLIVLGGDCTITLGVVAGLQRVHQDVRLAYFDGDADLNSPQRTRSGILDATGVAHLLGIADTPLAHIGRTTPMIAEHQLVLLGYDPSDPDSYDDDALKARPALMHFSDAALRAGPVAVASHAISSLTGTGVSIAVHFDVDAVDSRDLPLADFPHYGTGVLLHEAGKVLRTLLAADGVCALVLTEVNPTHDPTGGQLNRYLDTITDAISSALIGGL